MFYGAPPYMHEQMASNLLSALANYPVHASQLRQLGPEACATLYPMLYPVIYSIADVLMPGWQQYTRPAPVVPHSTTATPQPPYLLGTNRLIAPTAQTPEPRTPMQVHGADLSSLAQAFQNTHLSGGRVNVDGGAGGGSRRSDTSLVGCVQEIDEDENEDEEDSIGDQDRDAREAKRRVRQLRRHNPAAYQAVRQKLRESQQRDLSTGETARMWIENFLRLPLWEERPASEPLSAPTQRAKLRAARQKLDDAVTGHNDAKELMVSSIATWLRNPDGPGLVMGIHGPPGNGKTSLVDRGLAQAMGRPIYKIGCGGIGDASVLRGDRSVYIGSGPGKIAQALMAACTTRIILLFDELDRVSTRYGPEVHDVICNLTDPSRNYQFEDTYFGNVPLDLSKATIICTFNNESRLDAALKDRMGQIIRTHGLDYEQKIDITRRFLIPDALKQTHLTDEITFSDSAIRYVVSLCVDDLGARGIKSYIKRIVGRANCAMIEDERSHFTVDEAYARSVIRTR